MSDPVPAAGGMPDEAFPAGTKAAGVVSRGIRTASDVKQMSLAVAEDLLAGRLRPGAAKRGVRNLAKQLEGELAPELLEILRSW